MAQIRVGSLLWVPTRNSELLVLIARLLHLVRQDQSQHPNDNRPDGINSTQPTCSVDSFSVGSPARDRTRRDHPLSTRTRPHQLLLPLELGQSTRHRHKTGLAAVWVSSSTNASRSRYELTLRDHSHSRAPYATLNLATSPGDSKFNLVKNQDYDLFLELDLPASRRNQELGQFAQLGPRQWRLRFS